MAKQKDRGSESIQKRQAEYIIVYPSGGDMDTAYADDVGGRHVHDRTYTYDEIVELVGNHEFTAAEYVEGSVLNIYNLADMKPVSTIKIVNAVWDGELFLGAEE